MRTMMVRRIKKLMPSFLTWLPIIGIPGMFMFSRIVLSFIKVGAYSMIGLPLDMSFSAITYDISVINLSMRYPGVSILSDKNNMHPQQPKIFMGLMVLHFLCLIVSILPFTAAENPKISEWVWLLFVIPTFTWGGTIISVIYVNDDEII